METNLIDKSLKIIQFPIAAVVDLAEMSDVVERETQVIEVDPSTTAPNVTNFPDQHFTTLPSNNGLRGILSSFGPGLIRGSSLWEHVEDESGLGMISVLITPNGARLAIKERGMIKKAIDTYLESMIGVEGLKVVLALMATWYEQTQASGPKATATISLRRFLLDMGYDRKQANDEAERRKAYYCILYLSRLTAIAKETRYVPENANKPQGKKIRSVRSIEWTPLFHLKTPVVADENGLPAIPSEFTYGIGESFFAEMFGDDKQYFQLPTADALCYSAKHHTHELCLLFYLSNMVIVAHASFIAYLLTLIFHAGLQREQDFKEDTQRLRFLNSVLMAIEHLEKDGWIKREAQNLIDEILAINVLLGHCKVEELAPATKARIASTYPELGKNTPKELKSRKTALLKTLAKGKQGDTQIELTSGHLLEAQAKKIRRSRAVAVAKQQRAMEANAKRVAVKA